MSISPQRKEVDVDTPPSWDTGLSGPWWPKWPRESLSPWKIPFSEINLFLRGFRRSPWFTSLARNSQSHIINDFFDVAGGQPEPTSLLKYWNIFSHNFATCGPNDLIFWLHAKFMTTLFSKKKNDFDQPLPCWQPPFVSSTLCHSVADRCR